jgi:eukaryotic-like serine/threonine-protein kinase
MRHFIPLLLLLPLTFIPAQDAAAPAAAPEWIYTRGNPEMTGVSPSDLKLPLEQTWEFRTMPVEKARGDMLVSSAVVRNGKVYVGNKEGDFYCLELTTGKQLWKANAPHGSFEGAAGFSGDLVIAGCTDVFVYAWKADTGEQVWKFETEGEIHAAANVWTDPASKEERVFIGSHDNNMYCLDAKTGKQLWKLETANVINGGSPVSRDGKLALGGCDAVLHVIDAVTGKEERQIDVGAYIGNNVAVDSGVAYVAHYGNKVGAYSLADGAKVWEYGERDFEYYAAPAVLEKVVLAAGRDKRLHCLDRITGKQLWEYRCKDPIDSSPVACAGKLAVVGSDDGILYAINITDGKEAWKAELGAAIKTSPAVAGDWVIVGADDGVIYAFKGRHHELELQAVGVKKVTQ